MYPLSKKHSVENLKGNVRKKAITVKGKVDNEVGEFLLLFSFSYNDGHKVWVYVPPI